MAYSPYNQTLAPPVNTPRVASAPIASNAPGIAAGMSSGLPSVAPAKPMQYPNLRQKIADLLAPSVQQGQPLNILEGARMGAFSGAQGPNWTDTEYQNFWNRSGSGT